MNSHIVTQEQQLQMETMANDPWYAGFLAYCDGAQLEDMPTMAHKRGWWAALDAQAECEMPPCVDRDSIFYVEEAEDYESWLEDEEWIRRGC